MRSRIAHCPVASPTLKPAVSSDFRFNLQRGAACRECGRCISRTIPMPCTIIPPRRERLGDSMAGLGAAATLTRKDAEAIRNQSPGIQFVTSGVHENARILLPATSSAGRGEARSSGSRACTARSPSWRRSARLDADPRQVSLQQARGASGAPSSTGTPQRGRRQHGLDMRRHVIGTFGVVTPAAVFRRCARSTSAVIRSANTVGSAFSPDRPSAKPRVTDEQRHRALARRAPHAGMTSRVTSVVGARVSTVKRARRLCWLLVGGAERSIYLR